MPLCCLILQSWWRWAGVTAAFSKHHLYNRLDKFLPQNKQHMVQPHKKHHHCCSCSYPGMFIVPQSALTRHDSTEKRVEEINIDLMWQLCTVHVWSFFLKVNGWNIMLEIYITFKLSCLVKRTVIIQVLIGLLFYMLLHLPKASHNNTKSNIWLRRFKKRKKNVNHTLQI